MPLLILVILLRLSVGLDHKIRSFIALGRWGDFGDDIDDLPGGVWGFDLRFKGCKKAPCLFFGLFAETSG